MHKLVLIRRLVSINLFTIVLLGLGSAPWVAGQTVFKNPEYGFTIDEPKNWIATTKASLSENFRGLELSDDTRARFLREHKGGVLLAAYVKYPLNSRPGVNPTIQAWVRGSNLNRAISFQEFRSAIVPSLQGFAKLHTDYEFLVSPTETVVGGTRAVYHVSRYTLKLADGSVHKVQSRTFAIPFRNYFFQISFVDNPEKEDCSAEFEALLKTIKIG